MNILKRIQMSNIDLFRFKYQHTLMYLVLLCLIGIIGILEILNLDVKRCTFV